MDIRERMQILLWPTHSSLCSSAKPDISPQFRLKSCLVFPILVFSDTSPQFWFLTRLTVICSSYLSNVPFCGLCKVGWLFGKLWGKFVWNLIKICLNIDQLLLKSSNRVAEKGRVEVEFDGSHQHHHHYSSFCIWALLGLWSQDPSARQA